MTGDEAWEFYKGKNILAPMVRVNGFPTRLLAHEYGADIVYTEELIDRKFMHCKRIENEEWGTVDFVDEKMPAENPGRLVLRTRKEERDRLVLQIGTGEASRAMKCAELACKDARVIDINMGCPLKFSITNGAGAALLKKPETIRDILTTLRRNLPSDVGVTCKIRLLANVKDTIELAQAIEKTGVSAIGIHGRNVWQRPRDPAQWDVIKQVVDSVSCPVIANGDIFEYQDFDRIREATGAAAAMAARGAMWNQSIFSKDGLVPPRESLMKLMTKCLEWDHSVNSTKYLAREILIKTGYCVLQTPVGEGLNKAKTLAEVCKVFELPEGTVGRNRIAHLKRKVLVEEVDDSTLNV